MDIFTILIYQPIYNLLIIFYRAFGGDLALAIIAIAALSRLATYPITARQIKMAEQSQEFNDKVKQVKKKYKNNKEKQNQEMMKVQSQYLPGQLSGCMSLIIQLVLLINILNVIRNLFTEGVTGFNAVAYSFVPQFAAADTVNFNFLGIINLAQTPSVALEGGVAAALPYLILAVLVGASQFGANRILMGLRKKDQPEEQGKKAKKDKEKKKGEPEDFATLMQRSTKQTMVIFPVLLIFFALNFPAGLSLYWTVQSGLVIIQQLLVDKFHGSARIK
jgi:YidC/Oxa1 family membrane protein insertase